MIKLKPHEVRKLEDAFGGILRARQRGTQRLVPKAEAVTLLMQIDQIRVWVRSAQLAPDLQGAKPDLHMIENCCDEMALAIHEPFQEERRKRSMKVEV